MRTLCGFGLVALVLGFAIGCGKGEDKLDGTYVLVGMESRGEKLPQKEIDDGKEDERTFTIEGNKISKKGDADSNVTFTTDGSKKPKTIDITETRKSGKSDTMYGIYKLDGDTLTICMSDKAENRPTEFSTGKESKSLMMTLKKK